MTMRVVDDIADIRTGDKGDTLIVAAVAREKRHYDLLCRALSPESITERFGGLVTGEVTRTLLPGLHAVSLTVPGVLGGGVTGSPVLDGHGKTLSYFVAMLPLIEVGPDAG